MTITRDLAEWVAGLQGSDLPVEVRERVKDILLDTVASALAGHDAGDVATVVRLASALGGGSGTSIIGGDRLSLGGATLVNGYLVTAATMCDIHRPTACNVTPEVVPPAMAIGEREGSTGDRFLAAMAAGLEVTTRVGLGLKPSAFRARGWHAAGVTGVFGAAASTGRLLGLDAASQTWAFGLAGSQASGTYAQLGTPAIKFQQAHGAHGGLIAALLARDGFNAAEDALMAPDGDLFSAYSDGGNPGVVLAGLGMDWELARISLRAWPVAVHLQPVVTGLLAILGTFDGAPADIERVTVTMSEAAYGMTGRGTWDDRFRARLSAPYVTGVVLFDRRCWLEQFAPARLQDEALSAFIRDRVVIAAEAGRRDGTAVIEIMRRGGRSLREEVTVPKGEPANALSRADVVNKFRAAASPHLSAAATNTVIDMVGSLETLPSVRPLVGALRRSG